MSWKNTQQNSFADSLVVDHKSLSELDKVSKSGHYYWKNTPQGFRNLKSLHS
jgi:IS5 family transposase